MAMVGVKSGSL